MGQPGAAELLFLQSLPGLEEVLAEEAGRLGRVRRVSGGIELEGGPGLHADAALSLRIAERVLLRLAKGPVRRWREVEALLASAELDGVARAGQPLALEVAAVRVPEAPGRDTLLARLSQLWRRPVQSARGAADLGGPGTRLVLRVADGEASVSAEVGGSLLHRRGWRQEPSRAPMRETLAAGVLSLAGYRSDRPLWDPMCGSGTLVIEAALAARRVAPGLGRTFAAEGWPSAAAVDWSGRRDRLRSAVLPQVPAPVLGSDLNAGALGTARRNARRAGVTADVRLERLDVSKATPGALGAGLLVANLPYGRRVGGPRHELEVFDTSVAATIGRTFAGWRRALLVDDPARLQRAGGREPDTIHRLANGGIPVFLGIWKA